MKSVPALSRSRGRRNLPVILISGFAGAGKTSLIRHLLSERGPRRWSVLRDEGEIDLFSEIERVKTIEAPDAILIECAANLEPFFIAEHLVMGDENQKPPDGVIVDTLISVIDATHVLAQLTGEQDLTDLDLAFDEEDDRSVPEILIEQIEYADILVINKIDLISSENLPRVEALLSRLNPRARIFVSEHGRVASENLVGTRMFDLDGTDDGAGWIAELSGDFPSSDGGFGVSSFTFTARRPFHPLRLNEFLEEQDLNGAIRAKGYVWVASRHHEIGVWSLSGKASLLTYGGAWFAATPAREWPSDEAERLEIMKEWEVPFGDRRQEIAFIGLDMDESILRERLEECLMTADEMDAGPDGWFTIPDPLPDWHEDTDPESFAGWS